MDVEADANDAVDAAPTAEEVEGLEYAEVSALSIDEPVDIEDPDDPALEVAET